MLHVCINAFNKNVQSVWVSVVCYICYHLMLLAECSDCLVCFESRTIEI